MVNVYQSSAQTAATQPIPKTPEEYSKKFFEIYSTKPADALDYIFSLQQMTRDLKNDISEIKKNLKNTIGAIGGYDGYELIAEKQINSSMKLLSYMVKYDRQPIRFIFIFYKPKDVWNVYTFQYNTDLDDQLTDAARQDNLAPAKQ